MITENDKLINNFVLLQKRLLAEILSKYPECKSDRFLIALPKKGQILMGSEYWQFRRHGAGIEFTSVHSEVVDVHVGVTEPDFFDAYRLSLYAASIKKPHSLEEFEKRLEKIGKLGKIVAVRDSSWGHKGYKVSS